jgi:hypothetical protein
VLPKKKKKGWISYFNVVPKALIDQWIQKGDNWMIVLKGEWKMFTDKWQRTGYGCKSSWLTHSTKPSRALFDLLQSPVIEKLHMYYERLKSRWHSTPCGEWQGSKFMIYFTENKTRCFSSSSGGSCQTTSPDG